MTYLEKAKQILSESVATQRVSRCRRCLELEAQGVEILRCSECGYARRKASPRGHLLPHVHRRAAGACQLRLVRREGEDA